MRTVAQDRPATPARGVARRIAAILVAVLATLGLGVGAGLPAQAVGTGSITGTVTGPGGAPLAGVQVHAIRSDYTWSDVYGLTAADGSYTVPGLAAGSYKVEFDPPSGVNLAPEYWRDAVTWSAATPVSVSAGATVAGIDVQLAAGATISGTVTAPGGAPVAGVGVFASGACGGWCGGYAYTAADGSYAITGLPANSYTVKFSAPSGVNLAPEYWRDAVTSSAATPVIVTAGATVAGIDVQLAAGGTISGTVTGPGGFPLAGVDVLAGPFYDSPAGSALTAADGSYTITGLVAGSYTVKFYPPSGVNLAPEYWRDAVTSSAATPVSVTVGGTVSGINAQLAVGGTITGTVTGPGGTALSGVSVTAWGPGGIWSSADTAADGTYTITGLPAGSYTVEFYRPWGVNLLGEYWQDAATSDAATPVSVAAGGTVSGISAQLAVGGTITGTVTGPDGTALSGVSVTAWGGGGSSGSADTAADGTYTIIGLNTGSYTVEFEPEDSSLAPEYWQDAATSSSAMRVGVTAGGTVPGIDARFELAAGPVSGMVTDASGAAVSHVSVEVVDGAGTVVPLGWNSTDSDGSFSLAGLRAGDVKVAFARASAITPYVPQYFSGASTLGAASTVSLVEGAGTTGIDATLATGASITGRVLAADGSPRAGLEMVALTLDGSLPTRGGFTGADGRYVIEGLLPGESAVAAAFSSPRGADTFYRTGEVAPSAGNVTVTGTATTRGVDIVTGVSEQPLFLDALPGASFFSDIQWLAGQGITRGSVQPDGSVFFDSAGAVRREAMAAFLYRFAGSPAFTPPATSPFVDVAASATFYKEIAWLAGQGISTGTAMGDGTFEFRPAEPVSREAMAAFLYRFMGRPDFTAPAMSPFVDVPTSATFYKEIAWLAANHISTGTDLGDGTFAFRPSEPVRREAMAAFLHRTSNLMK